MIFLIQHLQIVNELLYKSLFHKIGLLRILTTSNNEIQKFSFFFSIPNEIRLIFLNPQERFFIIFERQS
ncbi:MAG TPA: hypothetical protein P5224_05360 [Mesotoga sp.]|nr:hypothetical protein [Mesotoga sp.]